MKNIKKKRKRKYNPNLIKARHSYTLIEIAKIYNIHPRTVQNWRKQGLKVIDDTTKPYLTYGEEVRIFLKGKRKKYTLKENEFFCPKCRAPRKSISDKMLILITGKKLGKNSKQVFIKGVCEICHKPLTLFSSDRKVQEMNKKGLFLSEHKTLLYGIEDSSLNTDMKRGKNNES